MSNHLYYLDSSNEYASFTILKQLKITLESSSSSSTNSSSSSMHYDYQTIQILSNQHYLFHEYKLLTSTTPAITYRISSTSPPSSQNIYLDIRDSGDCWLRICLNPSDQITIPSNIYHKFSTSATLSYPYEISYYLHDNRTTTGNLQDHLMKRYNEEIDTIKLIQPHTYRELICELCSQFYDSGWVTGTGGSISIRYGNRIFMTPSGVQKERIQPDELFVLDIDGNFLSIPPKKLPGKVPKLSDCSPLFLHSYRHRNAGAVLHSHDITCVLITAITKSNEFKISHQEMIKGIAGYGYHDELIVPIIENTAWESELADSLEQAILMYPKSYAVLVRDHGIYVWGDTWEQAKRHGECLHYLFNVAIQKYNLNITPIYSHLHSIRGDEIGNGSCITTDHDETMELQQQDQDHGHQENGTDEINERKRKRIYSSNNTNNGTTSSHANLTNKTCNLIYKSCALCNQQQLPSLTSAVANYKYIVMDIEGTTTPITFVKDILFPYARNNLQAYLKKTWQESSTQQDILNLCSQASDDLINYPNKEQLPSYLSEMIQLSHTTTNNNTNTTTINEILFNYLIQYVNWCIDLDRKISSLKLLQGKIWRHGYETNQLQSIVFPDIPTFLLRQQQAKIPIYIYSSGSMEAQYLLFKYTNYGDLRPYISCYFDTFIGHKRQKESYRHIYHSLGANNPSEILFLTDIIEEGYAASEVGINVILSNRPGNASFPKNCPFPIVENFNQI